MKHQQFFKTGRFVQLKAQPIRGFKHGKIKQLTGTIGSKPFLVVLVIK